MGKKPKILVIGTGGIIHGTQQKGGWKSSLLKASDLRLANKRLEKEFNISTTEVLDLHSGDMQPKNWVTIAKKIYKSMLTKKYDGIVVTHGTDTMHYTATAISFLIKDLNMPVVFTGAQITPFEIGSDASRNFHDAVMVAASGIAEVVIVYNRKIFRANCTTKKLADDFDAFQAFGAANIGSVQSTIEFLQKVEKKSKKTPKLYTNLETNVALIKVHPGLNPKLLEKIIESGVKGVVLEGYGVGNFPIKENSLIGQVKKAIKSGIPVVLTTECAMEEYWHYFYRLETEKRYKSSGVILGYNMVPHTALIKLMWVLAQTKNMNKIKMLLHKNIAGEITPITKR